MFLDLLAALLPAPERDALVRRGADPFRWSLVLGFAEFFLGANLLFENARAFDLAQSSAIATHLLEKVEPQAFGSFENRLAVTESGTVVWLAWILLPTTWLLASIPLVGIARMVAFAADHDAVGEPVIWLALRALQILGRPFRSLLGSLRFGPVRPDVVLREPGCDLVVLSCRLKPEWNELVSLEVEGRFYRLLRAEERQDGSWWAHAYLLNEADPNEVLRGLIRYEPPAPALVHYH